MVYGCQCTARKAVSGNTLQLVGYTSTKTNLLSKRQGEAALRRGGQKVNGWRRPQSTGQTRDNSQDTSAMQPQFQGAWPFYTGFRVHAHVPPKTCHTQAQKRIKLPLVREGGRKSLDTGCYSQLRDVLSCWFHMHKVFLLLSWATGLGAIYTCPEESKMVTSRAGTGSISKSFLSIAHHNATILFCWVLTVWFTLLT